MSRSSEISTVQRVVVFKAHQIDEESSDIQERIFFLCSVFGCISVGLLSRRKVLLTASKILDEVQTLKNKKKAT